MPEYRLLMPGSNEAPMTMLVFLAGAARAAFVATDLAPACRIVGLALWRRCSRGRDAVARQRLRTGTSQRELILAGRGIDLVRLHVRQRRRLRRRRGGSDLHAHQLRGHRLAQIGAHCLEQIEGLRLVLVERIALAIAAQSNDLAQMLKHHEMLAPEVIEGLE